MPTKHWIWSGYFPGSGHAFAEAQEGLSPSQLDALLVGKPLGEPLPEVRVTALSPGKLPGAMASAFHALLAADKVKKAVEAHVAEGVQYLPASLKGKRGSYHVVNPTVRVAALDRKKSEFETYPGTEAMRSVRKLVLGKIPADAPALFRLEEIPQLILVSDALKKALEKASASPGEFESPGEYRLGVFDDEEE